MLKLWVTSANLISYHSISKLLLQSAPAAAVKDNRLIFIVYLIILTTYFLLDVTKQSVAANPDIISQASEQPKPITQSTFAINDVALTHRSQIEVTSGVETGDRRSTDIGLNATGLFSPQVEESVSNKRVYRLDYRSNYSQIRTLRQQREITTRVTTPETLFGMRQQISFTGDCLAGMNNGNSVSPTGEKLICTYLPGLKTDESSIDPQKLIPTQIPSTSLFGDVVSPASLLAIQATGFQGGANGQLIGLDLYFPRIGAQSGNSQAKDSSFDRFESNTTVPMVAVGRIHQVILANGTETAIARTVRGFNYILGDVNTSQIAVIQAATELLPDLEPSLPDGKKGGSTTVDRNLILAANNNRTPENSFTAYYSGVGRGTTPKDERINSANYHGLWIGFSLG